MNKRYSILPVMVAGILLWAGCTVKEDRTMCPCILVLDMSEVDTLQVKSADLFVTDDDGFLYEEVLGPEDFREDHVVEVPRKPLDLAIWSGAPEIDPKAGLVIPYGEECPPVRFHLSKMETGTEAVREVVRMHKNHCIMTVQLNWTDIDLEDIVMIGNVNGYGPDGSPSEGGFLFRMDHGDEGDFRVVLPRQIDDSLIMEVSDRSGAVRRFSIGEYIARSGYDWTEQDLKDITVELDIAFLQVTLVIQGWDTSHRFDIVI